MALHEELKQDSGDYRFTNDEDEIVGSFGELHYVAAFPLSPQIARLPEDEALKICNGSASSKWYVR